MVKKGNALLNAILILAGVFIVIAIISPGFRNSINNLGKLLEVYKNPDLKFTNNYDFTSTQIGILSASEKCSDPNPQNIYYCPTGTTLSFRVNIYNGGLKMRALYATPKACPVNDCKDNIFDIPQGAECNVVPGETAWCNSGTRTFDKVGEYRIFPGSYCLLDAEYGCYTNGLTGPVRSDNSDNWITVIIDNPVTKP